MKTLGYHNKPFCGDCCSPYPKGSGKKNKRILKKIGRAQEKRMMEEFYDD